MKKEITIIKKEANPLFNKEETEIFEQSIKEHLNKTGIDFDNLDKMSKIKVLQKLINHCKRCELNFDVKIPLSPLLSYDKPKAGFISTVPSKTESKIGIPMSNSTKGGDMFRKYLQILDLRRDELYISNVVNCSVDYSKAIVLDYVKKCSYWNYIELKLIGVPKVIFTMGTYPTKLFMGENIGNILNIFGSIYQTEILGTETYIIPIVHPGYIQRTSNQREEIVSLLEVVRDNIL